eukprot:snap_masked-scaffold_25-processed-gene-5.10-mRNA-1 protein AED:1.00 eAED:1.00 QI:0/0/0/0/1/1/2/0/202
MLSESELLRKKQDRRTLRNVNKMTRRTVHSPQQLDLFKKVFEVYDADKDGVINLADLEKMVTSLTPGYKEPDSVKRMMEEVDLDKDGCIDLEEFVYMMTRILDDDNPEAEIKFVFDSVDKEKKGHIDKSMLQELFSQLGMELSENEMEDVMVLLDVNGDGVITFEEFKTAYLEYNIMDVEFLNSQNSFWELSLFLTICIDGI